MRRPSAPHRAFRSAGGALAGLALLCGAALAGEAEQALETLLAGQAPDEGWPDPCQGEAETRVYKLAATQELERLMQLLLADPFTLPMDEKGISTVLVAKPLPCGERLLSARVELWDSLALERRGGMARFINRLSDWYGRREPTLWQIVFPDEGVARKAQDGYRLTRMLEFDERSPWMSTINGYGVVVFALASNSLSGATLTFKTEKLVARKVGKKPRRVVSQRHGGSVALPGPGVPVDDPRQIRSGLGIDRKP